jgi:Fe-S cluster assembly iron-binding protein IscA
VHMAIFIHGSKDMIQVTTKAAEMIKQFLQNQAGPGLIRIILEEQGGKIPYLRMYLTEPGEDDTTVTEQGITFTVDKKLLALAQPIRIDYAEVDEEHAGFQIISRLPGVGWKRR